MLKLKQLPKHPIKVTGILLIMAALSIITAGAAVRGTQDFTLGCVGFESNGGRVILNRDNTGTGQERITFMATDGAGNVLYGPVEEVLPVGSSLEYPRGLFQNWTNVPQANPLFLTITSEAGNGFARETVYRRTDNCANIESYSTAALNASGLNNIQPRDGQTGEPLELNEMPYTPVSINDLADLLGLSGYGIVNTSRLNMRTGAGIQYRRVAVLNGGTELVILGRNEAASWWYVQVDNIRGWVSARYVVLRGNLQSAGVVPSQGEVELARFIFYQDYPVYAGPSTTTEQLCVMQGNLEYYVVGRTRDWDWYQVQVTCNGAPLNAWAQAELGALRRNGQTVPITQ